MRFIQEIGYTVRLGHEEAHQRWLIDNDAALRAAAPAGTTYLGTFTVVFSSEKHAGAYKVLMELDSYGAMDAGAAAMKDPTSDWARLLLESSVFWETDLDAGWSNGLLKNVVDATIWDPKQE